MTNRSAHTPGSALAEKPLVYVAGPYTNPDPVLNTREAFQHGLTIYESTGCPVIVPHLTLLGHAMFPRDIDFWYEFDLAQVAKCDVVYRFPGASTGADKEVAFAIQQGIPWFTQKGDLFAFIGQWKGRR